jgi:hypothetical protein
LAFKQTQAKEKRMERWTPASLLAALAIAAFVPGSAAAQAPAAAAGASQLAPAAAPADVASVDAIVAALYDVISGPAGKQRDWDRLRSLFSPQGKLVAVGVHPDGSSPATVMTVDDYIARTTKPFAATGFFESELARSSERFGQIVHVFSTYESRHAPADAKPFQRGINSIQLYNDGKRWWIVNLLWRAEDAGNPLPERYLKSR